MTRILTLLIALAGSAAAGEYQKLFNGKDLDGWKGNPTLWSVSNGVIVGETTPDRPTRGNTFLIWQGGEVADFEFRCQVRFKGNNSGVQYRSAMVDEAKHVLRGYQADLHSNQAYFGMLYGEKLRPRGIIAERGQHVVIDESGEKTVAGKIEAETEFKDWQWNELRIVASGDHLLHQINGENTVYVVDQHPEKFASGLLGLQLHAGAPMRVEFKDIELRHLDAETSKKLILEATSSGDTPESDSAWLERKPRPQWIWGEDESDLQFFVKSFQLPFKPASARLYAAADDGFALWMNRMLVAESRDWTEPVELEVAGHLTNGWNHLAVRCTDEGGPAGFMLKLEITAPDGSRSYILSDQGWQTLAQQPESWPVAEADAKGGKQAAVRANLGEAPWGVPSRWRSTDSGTAASARPKAIEAEKSTPASDITVPDGFVVELIYEVPNDSQGSWVALTDGPNNDLYASDQRGAGLYRIVLEDPIRVEKQPVRLSGAQGLEWAFGSLYFNQNNGHLYRAYDSNGDETIDASEQFPSATGGGEHGNHAVQLSPDGQHLFVVAGNHTNLPSSHLNTKRLPTWDEDLLLPRQWDGRGHARGRLAPGGWITRLDPRTREQTLISIGFRNQYDVALNPHDELFAYDADMEWDLGMPWYRPTRICHVVSGSDFGWRSGTGKWPAYYEDSLPPVVDIGPGSPTGLLTGQDLEFPGHYQNALFALDWTFGTLYAIHLEPNGASYTGRAEPFCYGSPLPFTDAAAGPDGALYFTTGGRNTQSALYRIRYTGTKSTDPIPAADTPEAAKARLLRRKLESFHGRTHASALRVVWPHLSSPDRFIRHAARIAIESQPVDQWAEKVTKTVNPQTRITGTVALARVGDESLREELIDGLLQIDLDSLTDDQFLGLLRAYALVFIRLGELSDVQRLAIIDALDFHLPHTNRDVNTELLRVLVHLRAPNVIAKGMDLIENRGKPEIPNWSELASRNENYGRVIQAMLAEHPPSREIGYAFMLRNLKDGWTLGQRRAYFQFLNEAAKFKGGASYTNFLANLRAEALGYCDNETREALADVTGENFNPAPDFAIKPPKGPAQIWTMEGLSAATSSGRLRKASFENGRSLFHAIGCASCHRFAGLGGDIGPDLTSVRAKFDVNYLLESIVEPSKVISDQYSTKTLQMVDGSVMTGLVVDRGETLEVYPPAAEAELIEVNRANVAKIEDTPVSQMPPGLFNALNADEVRDVVAYIMSGGNPKDRIYR